MLYEYKNELPNSFVYWCNATGDLHYNAEYWINDISELPTELQRAYNELWCENYWANCYIVKFDGKYGVALEAEYDDDFADTLDVSYNALLKAAKGKAVVCSKRYPECDVIFGENTMKWSNGSVGSIVSIIVPWNMGKSKFDKVAQWFDSMCYDMSK